MTEKEFNTRWNNHKQSFHNKKYKNSTSLSSHVWDLKEKHGVTPMLKWSIIKHARSYTPNSRNCPLCLQEKSEILFYPSKDKLLNEQSELIMKCRHMNKFMLANYKSKDWTQLLSALTSVNLFLINILHASITFSFYYNFLFHFLPHFYCIFVIPFFFLIFIFYFWFIMLITFLYLNCAIS